MDPVDKAAHEDRRSSACLCPPDPCHSGMGLPVDLGEGKLLSASPLAENFHLYFIGLIHNEGGDCTFPFQ